MHLFTITREDLHNVSSLVQINSAVQQLVVLDNSHFWNRLHTDPSIFPALNSYFQVLPRRYDFFLYQFPWFNHRPVYTPEGHCFIIELLQGIFTFFLRMSDSLQDEDNQLQLSTVPFDPSLLIDFCCIFGKDSISIASNFLSIPQVLTLFESYLLNIPALIYSFESSRKEDAEQNLFAFYDLLHSLALLSSCFEILKSIIRSIIDPLSSLLTELAATLIRNFSEIVGVDCDSIYNKMLSEINVLTLSCHDNSIQLDQMYQLNLEKELQRDYMSMFLEYMDEYDDSLDDLYPEKNSISAALEEVEEIPVKEVKELKEKDESQERPVDKSRRKFNKSKRR
ncbi:hypothetical protein RCL1_002852 [Eukaryota sp. TZLM3-RCL]